MNGQKFLGMYLERRSNLKLLILLADSRREPLSADAGVLEYAEDKEDRLYKILLVATKVSSAEASHSQPLILMLKNEHRGLKFVPFEELHSFLVGWLAATSDTGRPHVSQERAAVRVVDVFSHCR